MVTLYLGGTSVEVLSQDNSFTKLKDGKGRDVKTIQAEKIFIHPLLGTKDVS